MAHHPDRIAPVPQPPVTNTPSDAISLLAGEMAERLKAHAWKACVRASVPWVRIPLSPPYKVYNSFNPSVLSVMNPVRGLVDMHEVLGFRPMYGLQRSTQPLSVHLGGAVSTVGQTPGMGSRGKGHQQAEAAPQIVGDGG